ncbi:HAMP domain-containing sensor histidine kinase [Streptomyces sp. SID13031]|uniref:sensor histidine kinase n=1 Tax=Streptomyces sp. SID13031 TaxID=2706046 RepID=UPI0013CC3DF6|nr:HAMP domain-containing sensor histidine kinase [Streptomyces sp. SID13031]NEA36340.1 HAMP domain-containing histidine kinase [Streptomyces sp. SID13031]
MRHSVLVRFLGLSLAVALGAVIATAVIATYSTSEKLQGEIDQNTSQLQVDGDIYAQLSTYAADHESWSGVDKLVGTLSDKTGRRIALTDADGAVIADSARTLGAGPDLPSVPAATVDARNEGGGYFNAVAGATTRMATRSATAVIGPSATQYAGVQLVGSASWGLTDQEKEERAKLANQASACFQAKGQDVQVISSQDGPPLFSMASGQSVSGMPVAEIQRPASLQDDPCVPAGLFAPSAKAAAVNADEIRRSTDCLDAAGEQYDVNLNPGDGLLVVNPVDPASTEIPEAFFQCGNTARAAALTPYVAPEAKLYLGAKSTFNVFSGEGLARTAATALGVLLIAALVMVFAGRRLVRPILALTGAAQRMTNGDHAARVPVTGRDEVARLGHAFNAMAESIQHHDHQRKAMVSDVAHELRTPLANIKGYLVASEDGVVPLDSELVTSLLEEAGLLERLVSDLQDLALADAGKLRIHPELRDLSELAQQVVSAHRPAAEAAGVTLTAEVNGPAPAVVDTARIRQALGNLVANAIRFTPADGKVLVGVRRVGNGYNLTVTDNGTGISAEHLPYLFDRFYRAEQSRSRTTGGSGLGLAITKHLVEAHRGSIGATSRLGHGSTFTIQLPAR